MHDGTVVLVAADGYPVNFFTSESVPGELMQPVLALLLMGAHHLVSGVDIPPGIVPFPGEVQRLVEDLWKGL